MNDTNPDSPNADTWGWRDLPVLRAAARGVDEEPLMGIRFSEVAQQTGLSSADVLRAAKALESDHLVELKVYSSPHSASTFVDVSGEARRLAGQWPTPESALDRMIAALEAIAANTDEDDDTRTRARKILDNLGGAGRQVGISVLGAAISGQIPGV